MRKTPATPRISWTASGRVQAVEPVVVSLRFGSFCIAAAVPQSFVELRRRMHKFIYCQRTGYRAEARQIFQETHALLLGRPPHSRDEANFPFLLANLLRQLLTAHVRARTHAQSFPGEAPPRAPTIVDIDAALVLLESRDPLSTRLIELYYFAGLDLIDVGDVLVLEPPVIRRQLRLARAWLIAHLVPDHGL